MIDVSTVRNWPPDWLVRLIDLARDRVPDRVPAEPVPIQRTILPGQVRPEQIAEIIRLRAALEVSDEAWRDHRLAPFAVASARDLSASQATQLIEVLTDELRHLE